MFGRRSHQRFVLSNGSTEATLRMLRDVVVERVSSDELVVVGRHAAVVGDALQMQLAEADEDVMTVQVAESKPVVSDGTVRHRILLRLTDLDAAPGR